MKIFGKNNNFDNQPINNKQTHKSDMNYEEKDIANSPNPSEYLGRSQVVFTGCGSRGKGANVNSSAEKSFEPVKLTETPILSKEDAIKHLKKYYFTDEDITALDLNDKETLSQISNFKGYLDSGIINEETDLKDFKEYMDTQSPEEKKEWLKNQFSGACKYANKDNIEAMKEHLSITEDGELYDFIEFLKDSSDPERFLEKLPLISYIEGKLDVSDLKGFKYNSDEFYTALTPKRAGIIKQINEVLPDNLKMKSAMCISLGEDDDLTPELVQNYCDKLSELSKYGIIDKSTMKYNYSGDDLKTATEKLDCVSNMLKDYPMELDSSDSGLDISKLYELSQREDIEEVQTYINSLSPDAKLKGIYYLPDKDSTFPKDKMAEICNIIFDKDYGKIKDDKLFDFIIQEGTTDSNRLDGIIELLKVHKGTDNLDTYYPERALHVGNKDYSGAAKAILLKRELDDKKLYYNENDFHRVMCNEKTDFNKFNKILEFMRDNDVKYYDYPNYIYTSENGLEKLRLRKFIKAQYWMSDDSLKILDNLAENIKNEDEMQFVQKCFLEEGLNGLLFNVEDVQTLHQEYQKRPEQLLDVLNLRYEDGRLRYSKMENILALADSYGIDKDYTNFVMNLKRCDEPRHRFYEPKNIKDVVEAAQIDKVFVNKLLAEKVKYDENGYPTCYIDEDDLAKLNNGEIPEYKQTNERISYVNSSRDIKNMTEIHAIDPELTDYLIDKFKNQQYGTDDLRYIVEKGQEDKDFVKFLTEATKTNWRDETQPRFSINRIKEILENAPENKQFVRNIINKTRQNNHNKNVHEPYYDDSDIINLCAAAKLDEGLTRTFMNMKYQRYNRVVNRFEPNEIKPLIEASKIDKKLFNKLLNKSKKEYNGDYVPQYASYEITSIMNTYLANKPLVKSLIDENDKYPRPEYSVEGIKSIVEADKKDSEYTKYLLSLKTKIDNRTYPLLRDVDVLHVLNAHEKNPEYTEVLLNMFEKDSSGNQTLVYCGGDIESIAEVHNIDSEFTEKLVNQKTKTDNGVRRRFNGYDIAKIVQGAQENKDLIIFLVDHKTVQDDGNEEYTYSPNDIINFIKNSKNCDVEFLKHLTHKSIINEKGNRVPQFTAQEVLSIANNTLYEDFKDLEKKVGENLDKYNINDVLVATKFLDMHGKQGINEIAINSKKDLLRKLVSANVDLFNTSDVLKQDFPMIPKTQEEYCEILPALVRSLGIETNKLSEGQITKFNENLVSLSDNLKKLSDEEYNALTITQEYDKDSFTKDVLEKVKDLEPKERQKVYDYFGFELHENPKNYKTGFSIVGYPVNLNNGKKLTEITDKNTKKVVEDLRENVIRFSENNQIECNNKTIEKELNEIVSVLPELRTMINKPQHKTHDFDVFKHSLKVMQKVVQDEKFEQLNDSDKKIMLLATLMHDITKYEGTSDGTHPMESSYDTFFIAKKFNLPKDEEIKLYTLIRHHEWLSKVNTAKTEEERQKAQQSIAFDLQQNNLFDMELMFTHADLKSVKNSDLFHDKTDGDSRIDFNGERRSFGEAADFHAEKIKEYIRELKKTQPLLPTTKMPKASQIEKLITKVNSDGSTNIKGVYVKEDENGKRLVVLKFNEVEDSGWEAMGLPKGSSTKGVIAHCNDGNKEYDVETGNIKFFVHGLDYPNQLAKFDAFSLLNSDALLSVSYAERPETKYRFFRAQGVILEDSADYVYGGGNTDTGSGCGKDIQQFKDGYVFGGYREHDRKYISNLVKEATGMNDDEYVEFVEKYKNKPMTAIQPKETRDKLIKTFATINSNSRKGNREYNEMYLSNPRSIMGVYAYSWDYDGGKIPDPVKFLEENDERTHFLQDYAKDHDVPFVIFGD